MHIFTRAKWERFCDCGFSGPTCERWRVSNEKQDWFSLDSQNRSVTPQDAAHSLDVISLPSPHSPTSRWWKLMKRQEVKSKDGESLTVILHHIRNSGGRQPPPLCVCVTVWVPANESWPRFQRGSFNILLLRFPLITNSFQLRSPNPDSHFLAAGVIATSSSLRDQKTWRSRMKRTQEMCEGRTLSDESEAAYCVAFVQLCVWYNR